MDVQVIPATIGTYLSLWIAQIVQNHYSHDLKHYYETIINYNLQVIILYLYYTICWSILGTI